MNAIRSAVDPGALITPVILTYNEAPNIGRGLERVAWARRVVVLDSGSTDETERIARSFPNVAWHTRPFDTHGKQWEHAIRNTSVDTPYVLALDADYQVPASFVRECADRFLPGDYAGGIAGFEYRVLGQTLMGSVYPAKIVLFRLDALRVTQPGHSQEIHVDGAVYTFSSKLVHEDLKPVSRFAQSQIDYSRLEQLRLEHATTSRWQDVVRKTGLMPLVAGPAAYIKAGGPLRGSASLRYAWERVLFECLLAMRMLGRGRPDGHPTEDNQQ